MKKPVIVLFLLSATVFSAFAENRLQIIYSGVSERFVTPEKLDRLLREAAALAVSPGVHLQDDSLILKIYNQAATSYAANNHFRQAYEVYVKYARYKEATLAAYTSNEIKKANENVDGREAGDVKEEGDLKATLDVLTVESTRLDNKIHAFKRNISFLLIILSSVFAIMLVGAGIRLINLRSKTRQNRDRIRKIHSAATIGTFIPGLQKKQDDNIQLVKNKLAEIRNTFKSSGNASFPAADRILSETENALRRIKSDS